MIAYTRASCVIWVVVYMFTQLAEYMQNICSEAGKNFDEYNCEHNKIIVGMSFDTHSTCVWFQNLFVSLFKMSITIVCVRD